MAIVGCDPATNATSRHGIPASNKPARIATDFIPNAVRVHEKVISGGLPEGENAFKELKSLGIQTIVCVDGAKPDVEMASQFGLRYVHLPHGYDGISEKRGQELAKAVRDLEGPVYIHCHHGKHRSPAAAAVACVGAGFIPSSDALAILKLAGTSSDYHGLYRSTREARQIDDETFNELKVAFRPVVEIPPMADAMVELDMTFHHLQQLSENGWKALPKHSDISPAHEALILREHFVELLRTEETKSYPSEFSDLLAHSIEAAKEIESMVKGISSSTNHHRPDTVPNRDAVKQLDQMLNQIRLDCRRCHEAYRN